MSLSDERNPLRILLLTSNIGRVGDATRAVALAKELVRRGHRCTVAYLRSDRRLTRQTYVENGVRIVESPWLAAVPGFYRQQSPLALAAQTVVALRRYDVYHGFIPMESTVVPWLLAKRLHPRSAFLMDQADLAVDGGFRGTEAGKRGRRLWSYRWSVRTERTAKLRADAHTVVCEPLRQRALQQGVPEDRIHHLLMGPSSLHPRVEGEPEEVRRTLGLDPLKPMIGYSAFHLTGWQELIEALPLLRQRGHDFQLLVTGSKTPEMQREIDSAGLAEHTRFAGRLDDAEFSRHLAACDILLAPMQDNAHKRHSFPSKLVDYAAVGRAIVAGDVGDTGTFLRDHGIGVAYRNGAEDLACAIGSLLEDSQRRRAMGRRGQALVDEKLSWRHLATDFEELYYSILHDTHGR